MKKLTAMPFYRPASAGTPTEDGYFTNHKIKMFGVCDGVSGPSSNPGIHYKGGITGGQMIRQKFIEHGFTAFFTDAGKLLKTINEDVMEEHLWIGVDLTKEAVAGACASVCQIVGECATLIIIGDCFAVWRDGKGFHFLTNFDQAAFDFEKRGNEEFQRCLNAAEGHKGKAWDLYFSYFSWKQFHRANKNIGYGGHAMLNGDPVFSKCWTEEKIDISDVPWILLGTDGLLPASKTNPANHSDLAKELVEKYTKDGIQGIIKWRDKIETEGTDYLPHIGKGAWPEATAVEIKFE